jgi:hypothetical protein
MTRPTHYGRAYHSPHPDTLLAYLSRGVRYLSSVEEKTILNDAEWARAFEIQTRRKTSAEFPELAPEKIDTLVAERILAGRLGARCYALRQERALMKAPAPKRGNRRLDVPRHEPLRPETLIIAACVVAFEMSNRGKSKNWVYDQVAQHLSQGLRACDKDDGLEARGVRSAEQAFWDMHGGHEAAAKRAYHRYQRHGKPHPWDRRSLDLLRMVEAVGGPTAFHEVLELEVGIWIRQMEGLYHVAKTIPEFEGLRGEALAEAIDQYAEYGFAALIDRRMKEWVARDLDLDLRPTIANEVA